ncbi:MAG: hypothetical protein U0X39_05125 [Bacteroidales bacterium]
MRNRAFRIFFLAIIIILSHHEIIFPQTTGISNLSITPRLSFLTYEKEAEIILNTESNPIINPANLVVTDNGLKVETVEIKKVRGITILTVPLSYSAGNHEIVVRINFNNRNNNFKEGKTTIIRLRHKPNEVKFDRLTGAMIVNKRNFLPFGFYTYSPVHPSLLDEEVVKGFNMISPYQKIKPETLSERKAYMDRCALLGLKVHYNLLSVSGGGGVNSKIDDISEDEKRNRLVNEIKTFMDHPALLAWYIADEPNGNKTDPAVIEEIYNTVKRLDPWHPVSVVFSAPFSLAKKYSEGTDIVMADPYPIPDYPATLAGDVTSRLVKEFGGNKPVWIVPQSFGGGELWRREPTWQEIRSMTYQAIIGGAKGIQYFIRQGPNSFPKSTSTWNECGRIAIELQSISPWILSDENTIAVRSSSDKISHNSYFHNGQLLVVAVNKKNEPAFVTFTIEKRINSGARVMFENREIIVRSGVFSDYLSPLGSQVYIVPVTEPPVSTTAWPGNLVVDPGFEDYTSPGIPAACYAWNGADRGATFFTDPVDPYEGNYSLRLVTPGEGNSISLKFFPLKLATGRSYLVSVMAKTDPERRYTRVSNGKAGTNEAVKQFAEIAFGELGKARFSPDSTWKQYIVSFRIPEDSLPYKRVNVTLRMPGQGTGWFDLLQVIEDPVSLDH